MLYTLPKEIMQIEWSPPIKEWNEQHNGIKSVKSYEANFLRSLTFFFSYSSLFLISKQNLEELAESNPETALNCSSASFLYFSFFFPPLIRLLIKEKMKSGIRN